MSAPETVYCPACGKDLISGARFCRACGYDIGARTQAVLQAAPAPAAVPDTPAPDPVPSLPVPPAPVPTPAAPAPSAKASPTRPEPPPPAPSTAADAPTTELPPDPPASEPRFSGKVIAIAIGVVVALCCGVAAFVILSGDDDSGGNVTPSASRVAAKATVEDAATPDVTETPTPTVTVAPAETPDPLEAEVRQLDELMQLSVRGRAAAVAGRIDAAITSRKQLLTRLHRLAGDTSDPRLKAAIAALVPAVEEALRQNRECASACSTGDLERVGRMKHAALEKVNPLLREYAGTTYRTTQI